LINVNYLKLIEIICLLLFSFLELYELSDQIFYKINTFEKMKTINWKILETYLGLLEGYEGKRKKWQIKKIKQQNQDT